MTSELMTLIRNWFDTSLKAGERYPYTGIFSTLCHGKPAQRAITIRGFSERGLVFFGDERSAKGNQLHDDPSSALHFLSLTRGAQLQLQGVTTIIHDDKTLPKHWASRSEAYKIGVLASRQSETAACAEDIDQAFAQAAATLMTNPEVGPPPYYCAFVFEPTAAEFWTADELRRHDRRRITQSPTQPDVYEEELLWP